MFHSIIIDSFQELANASFIFSTIVTNVLCNLVLIYDVLDINICWMNVEKSIIEIVGENIFLVTVVLLF